MSRPSDPDKPPLRLSIINLDDSISKIDHTVADTAKLALDHLSCTTPSDAHKSWHSSISTVSRSTPQLREKVDKSILRFRQDRDRWTSLTSLLLKSIAFYRSLDPAKAENDDDVSTRLNGLNMNDKDKQSLSIVDLPRTKKNRPYLPLLDDKGKSIPSNKSEDGVKENCHSMMNVSHQYPWACMVQQQLEPTKDNNKSNNRLLVGLDAVVFDARLSQYTPTITEFMKHFVGSFTPWEWKRINNFEGQSFFGGVSNRPRSDQSKLKEFFLRWSMKEAYTKALGQGMHINFDEFETRLHSGVDVGIDNTDTLSPLAPDLQEEGIWRSTMKQGTKEPQLSVIGKVKRIKAPASWGYWEFIFIPLGDEGNKSNSADKAKACSCICRGPLGNNALDNGAERTTAVIESMTLVDLIEFHGSSPL